MQVLEFVLSVLNCYETIISVIFKKSIVFLLLLFVFRYISRGGNISKSRICLDFDVHLALFLVSNGDVLCTSFHKIYNSVLLESVSLFYIIFFYE